MLCYSERQKILTNGSFGTLCGSRTSKFGLWPPDACIEGLGTALVHHCDRTNIICLVFVLQYEYLIWTFYIYIPLFAHFLILLDLFYPFLNFSLKQVTLLFRRDKICRGFIWCCSVVFVAEWDRLIYGLLWVVTSRWPKGHQQRNFRFGSSSIFTPTIIFSSLHQLRLTRETLNLGSEAAVKRGSSELKNESRPEAQYCKEPAFLGDFGFVSYSSLLYCGSSAPLPS